MCFIISLFPATVWTMFGFCVLYLSAKATGRLQQFGRILAVWIFFLAFLMPVCGAYLTISGRCPLSKVFCASEHDRGCHESTKQEQK